MSLPEVVIETCSFIYRQALRKRMIKGRSINLTSAASVYMACRQCHIVRSLDEIAFYSNTSKKDLARTYRFLFEGLGCRVPLTLSSSLVSDIVCRLDLSGRTEILALQILEKSSEIKLTNGRSPNGIAAACVYISVRLLDDHVSQGKISDVVQVTEVTIRNRYKELVDKLDFIISI